MSKPFSQACANNQVFILQQLTHILQEKNSVLEIGSGTGQHATYFSAHLPHLSWQTSDLPVNHDGILQWLADAPNNCQKPLALDIQGVWPDTQYDSVFTANTLHICAWELVVRLFEQVAGVLHPSGLLIVYGPFNYEGQYTSDSNAQFDQFLKETNPQRGIRDIENIIALANDNHLSLQEDIAMPANNRLLVFQYQPR